jgi:serine/threonine protein kinase
MKPAISCVEPAQLRQLLALPADAAERRELEAHLHECERCRRVLLDVTTAAVRSTPAEAITVTAAHPNANTVDLPVGGAALPSAPTRAREFEFLEPSANPAHLGRLGHYELLEIIGRGGMGTVFKAHDEKLQRTVAVKMMSPDLAMGETARQRFIREARAAAQVAHENVVTIHAVEDGHPIPYLVMQFVAGESLQQRLARGPMEPEEIIRIGREAAAGLAAAHAKGLVHRDIKPANLLLESPTGRVKITDFGLARAIDDASVSQSGAVIGTPLYMSPEQARGDNLDHRADLFSLGSVLYTLCTGRPAFPAGNTMAVLRRVCDDAPESLVALNPRVPLWLEQTITRLLAKDPAARIATAGEVEAIFAERQYRVRNGDDKTEEIADPPFAVPVPARRSRRLYYISAAVLLLAAGVTTALVIRSNRKADEEAKQRAAEALKRKQEAEYPGIPPGTTINIQFPNMEGFFPKNMQFPDGQMFPKIDGNPWQQMWENHPFLRRKEGNIPPPVFVEPKETKD